MQTHLFSLFISLAFLCLPPSFCSPHRIWVHHKVATIYFRDEKGNLNHSRAISKGLSSKSDPQSVSINFIPRLFAPRPSGSSGPSGPRSLPSACPHVQHASHACAANDAYAPADPLFILPLSCPFSLFLSLVPLLSLVRRAY